MPTINVQPKEFQNGDRVISYTNTVGTAQETFTFPVPQETIILWNKGSKNISYTIGGNTGTLGKSESVKVTGSFTSIALISEIGTQAFELWAEEEGTTGTSPEAIVSLGNQVSSLSSSLAQIAIQAGTIGLIANDQTKATQNATVLNSYLIANQNAEISFSGKDYHFDNTITVTSMNKLIGKKGTRFILTVTNKDLIYLKPFAAIENIVLKLPLNHNKSGIALYGGDYTQWSTNQLHYVRNVFVYGDPTSLQSTGISLDAANGFNVSNFSCYNVTILNCSKGVSITQSGTGWVNGNFFDNIYTQNCVTGLSLGTNCSGNRFIYQHQFGSSGVTGVYCNGEENMFIGKVWDALPGQIILNFDSASKSNFCVGTEATPNIMNTYILDNGQDNTVSSSLNNTPQVQGAYRYDASNSYVSGGWQKFNGAYSDVLYYADKKYTVNLGLGNSSIVFGTMASLFSNAGIIFNNAAVGTPITIEIIFPTPLDYVPEFGITFQNGWIPQTVKIEYAGASADPYVTLKNISNNKNFKVSAILSAHGGLVGKIKFTLANGVINPTINETGFIGVGNIYMFQTSQLGSYYLPAGGGKMYGDITFNAGQGIIIKDALDGHTYRLVSINGTPSMQLLS